MQRVLSDELRVARGWFVFALGLLLSVSGCQCGFVSYGRKAMAREATVNLERIAQAELAYWKTRRTFRKAGPSPARVPGNTKARFEDPEGAFREIGFQPETGYVWYQYEVAIESTRTAVVIARGDLNGDGIQSEFRLNIEAERPVGAVIASNQLE